MQQTAGCQPSRVTKTLTDKYFILNKRGQNKNLHCEKLATERCGFKQIKQPRQLMPFAFLHNYLFSNLLLQVFIPHILLNISIYMTIKHNIDYMRKQPNLFQDILSVNNNTFTKTITPISNHYMWLVQFSANHFLICCLSV